MIDQFALALSHLLLALAGWRMLLRGDLDNETAGDADPVQPQEPRGGA